MKSLIINCKKFGKLLVVYDNQDHEVVSSYHWSSHRGKTNKTHYARTTLIRNGKRRWVLMHRLLMDVVDPEQQVDHKNGNGLDNTRSNLRIASSRGNSQNSSLSKRNKVGFKGVTIIKNSKKSPFRAVIQVDNKQLHLGCYPTVELAAKAYNEAAFIHHGDFARLNDI
jgi:hypothetical protein